MKEKEYMLTTIDNPFNPFNEFENWFKFDTRKGYNTCSLLARKASSREDLTSIEEKIANNEAIDEILKEDFLCIYKRVTEDDYSTN